MNAEIKGKKLIVTIDLQEPALSKTGKSFVVVSSGGFQITKATFKGSALKLNVTGIIPATTVEA